MLAAAAKPNPQCRGADLMGRKQVGSALAIAAGRTGE